MQLSVSAYVVSVSRGREISDESQGRGIHVTTATPDIWKWQFRIGDAVKTGKTETRINLLAIRRVQQRIDRELKQAAREQTSQTLQE